MRSLHTRTGSSDSFPWTTGHKCCRSCGKD